MKILLICQHFYPESFRVNDICAKFVSDGNQVTVLTGYPNYPEGRIYKGYHFGHHIETIFGAKVYRAIIIPRFKGFFMRFFNYVSFAYSGILRVIKIKRDQKKFDVIFVFQSAPVCQIYPGIKAKKVFHAPLISYCTDEWPEQVKIGGITKGPLYRLVWNISKKMYKNTDFLINASPSFVEYNHKTNDVPYEKMSFLLQHCNDLPPKEGGYQKIPNGKIDILFAGNIGKYQDLETVIQGFALSKINNLTLHVLGGGSSYDSCVKKTQELGLDKQVIFYGRKPRDEVYDFYKKCDACLLPLSMINSVGETIPSKLTEYLAAGKPILGVCGGDAAELIKTQGFGLCVDPGDPKKVAELFTEYCSHQDKYSKCGEKGREYYLKYGTLDHWITAFYDIADKLTKNY